MLTAQVRLGTGAVSHVARRQQLVLGEVSRGCCCLDAETLDQILPADVA